MDDQEQPVHSDEPPRSNRSSRSTPSRPHRRHGERAPARPLPVSSWRARRQLS